MMLIAESGSTKCDWVLIDELGSKVAQWKTIGFNPYFHTTEEIIFHLRGNNELFQNRDLVKEVFFYGAGCNTDVLKMIVRNALNEVFVSANNVVGHDLEAAVYSLYDGAPIVACIIGTGSNSCFYNGEELNEATPALSYILGDEGSASYIGKRFISDYLYGQMPKELSNVFESEYRVSKEEVINRVYHQNHPNVFLAGFGPFGNKFPDHDYVKDIIREGFSKFLDYHVLCYPNKDNLKVSFVGSVASAYVDILKQCVSERGYSFGKVIAEPINALVNYHLKEKTLK